MTTRRTFPSRGRKIDFKQWDAAPGLIVETQAAGLLVSGSLAFSIPATLLRFRGYISASFDETKQVGDRLILTTGVAILSTDAVTAGAASLPDPATEPEFPWIWWGEFRLDSFFAGAVDGSGPGWQRYEIDSKAMRKIKPGESLVTIVEITNVIGAPVTLIDVGQLRVLIGT